MQLEQLDNLLAMHSAQIDHGKHARSIMHKIRTTCIFVLKKKLCGDSNFCRIFFVCTLVMSQLYQNAVDRRSALLQRMAALANGSEFY